MVTDTGSKLDDRRQAVSTELEARRSGSAVGWLLVTRAPDRKWQVYFLGAGFGCAGGLPNTAALLDRVHDLASEKPAWGVSKNLEKRLDDAYAFFYPDKGSGFRPEVVDFFSILSAYLQIDQGGLPEGFPDRPLLADLRFAIVHVLCDRLRLLIDADLQAPHDLADDMVQPGRVIITTNWDTLPERLAESRGVPFRLSGPPKAGELTILKLHGSIDWLRPPDAKKPVGTVAYGSVDDLCGSQRARHANVNAATPVLRTRVTNAGALWRTIKGAANDPLMLTMAPGKADALGPLLPLWGDAYRALSAAANIHVVGYSMPADDIEIRTLIRAGVLRGDADPDITVLNPAPDVHSRFRELISREIDSEYRPVPGINT